LRFALLTKYYSSDQIKNEMSGHVEIMGKGIGAYRLLVRRPEGKRSLGIPRRRWEDNIKMGVQEVECGCVD
jgi:hypothetical protein